MAQPVVDPNWASDTNFSSGPENGNPTKVNPGAPALAQGFVPLERFKAQRINYTLYWICQWITTYLKVLHSDSFFLGQAYTWTAAHVFNALTRIANTLRVNAIQLVTGGDLLYTDSSGAAATRARAVSLPLAFVAGSTSATAYWKMTTLATAVGGQAVGNMYFQLPSGAVITNISCWFTDAGTPGTFKVFRETFDILTGAVTRTQIGSTGTSNSDVAIEILTTGAVSHTVDNGGRYVIEVDSGAAGAIVHGIVVQFNDVGFTGNG